MTFLKASWLQSPSLSNRAEPGGPPDGFSLGSPFVFHRAAIAAAAVVALLSAILLAPSFLVVAIFLLVTGAISWLWSRQALRHLSLKATLSQERAFPGETVELKFELVNEKWLPLTWLDIEEQIPYRLANGAARPPSPFAKERARWTTAMAGRQRLRWAHRLECRARGDYRLGPARLRSGDAFGIYPKEMLIPSFLPLLVYPKIIPVDKLGLPLRELLGEQSANRNIYEDANRTMGTRDYRRDDAFKRIHWKASARCPELQAREYESSTNLNLLLILEVQGFTGGEPESDDDFEHAVSVAASLAFEAQRQGFPVGLLANSRPEIRVPVSSGQANLVRVLEELARIQIESRLTIGELLGKEMGCLAAGTTPVIVAQSSTPALTGTVRELGRRGYSARLVTTANVKNKDQESK